MRTLFLLSCVVTAVTAVAAFAPWSMRAEPDRPGLGTVPVRPTALQSLSLSLRPIVLGSAQRMPPGEPLELDHPHCAAGATVAGVRRARRRVQRSVVCSLGTVMHAGVLRAGVLRAKGLRAGVSTNTTHDSQCNQ
jgi:hypothetical protein